MKGMHVAQLNTRSMVNKWDVIKAQFVNSNLHIISFTETWLHEKLPSGFFNLSNDYDFIRQDRGWSEPNSNIIKKGGGVGTYIRNSLNYSENTHKHLNRNSRNIESQWISILQKPNKTILLCNTYRPPQGNIERFLEIIEENLNDIDLTKVELILMGDLNIDVLDKKNPATKKLLDIIKQYGLKQLIKEPTRYAEAKHSCIDLFITNSDIISRSGVTNVHLSDHQMILLTRKKMKMKRKSCDFIGRSYRNYNKEDFQRKLQESSWNEFNTTNDVSEKWSYLINKISLEIEKTCPLKKFKIKQIKEPWPSPDLIELIKDKDKALKTAKKEKDPNLWKEAKRIRNNCTRRLRQARADYISENLNNNAGDQKKFWRNIQGLIPNKGTKTSDINLIDQISKSEIPYDETASFINDFFVDIGPSLAQNCDRPWTYVGPQVGNHLENVSTNIEEIIALCKNININKSSCINNLSSEILRDAFLAIPEKLVVLFNLSFETGEIPDVWKIGKVTPLQKPGNKNLVNNLRPISLLPLVSKLIEKIVHNRIYNFCEQNNILDNRQGGFRPDHSTISTTSRFLNDIYKAMNTNKITISVYIDAMKAFDTVNHEILLKKIYKLGLRGNLGKWLKNYLTNRKQCTIANNIVSELKNITCGVPQGSVCGPLLFLLYINDLPQILNYTHVSLYADDTVIYIHDSDAIHACNLLQHDLTTLQNWCNMNKLTINCNKTKFCIYGMRSLVKKSKSQNIVLSLNNQILEQVCSYKYLGFALDEHLNFNRHY